MTVADVDRGSAGIVQCLTRSMDRPLTAPGSERLAWLALAQLPEIDLDTTLDRFGGKLLETLADDQRHDTLVVPPGGGVAVWFVTWPGTHQEVLPQRFGVYLDRLYAQARWLADAGVPLIGFLEIDAYVTETTGSEYPFAVEVEYSYLPGALVGGVSTDDPRWNMIVVNPDLCSAEERQAIAKFIA
jgi:hypothetical protein